LPLGSKGLTQQQMKSVARHMHTYLSESQKVEELADELAE